MRGFEPAVVKLGNKGISEADVVVHDETAANGGHTFFRSQFAAPLPLPLGAVRAVDAPVHEDLNAELAADARAMKGVKTLDRLFNSGDIWIAN